MKKSFWGYNVQEVDESVGFLESQNVKLERQVKQLTAELEKARGELEEASAAREDGQMPEGASENAELVAQLQQKLTDSEQEKQELSQKIASLNSRLSELSAAAEEPKEETTFDDIGNICKSAYEDMHIAKQKTKDNLKNFLDEFWQKWNSYEELLTELSRQNILKQQESKNSFISYADHILQVYGEMESSNRELDSHLAEIVERRTGIANELNGILTELDKDYDEEPEEEAEEEPEETVEEPEEDRFSILSTIRKLRESRIVPIKTQEAEHPAEEAPAKENKGAEAAEPAEEDDTPSISPNVNIRNII